MENNPFGLLAFLHWNHDWNKFHFPPHLLKKAVEQIRDLGVGLLRMDILWSDVYAGPHQTNFSRYDDLITLIRSHDIQILGLLHYNKSHSNAQGENWNHPPDSFEEFAGYVADTVAHFKGQVDHWEIWNEPNHPVYWSGPKDRLKTYSELLRLSYQAAKSANSNAFVLNGGLAQPVVEDTRNLYENGAKDFMDALSIHPFMDPLSPSPQKEFDETIRAVENIMSTYGDSKKKIWITEMGCPGVPIEKTAANWFQGHGLSEGQQAAWLEKQFGFLKNHPSIEKMFWAFYRDTGDIIKEGADDLGLVRFDFTPKPAFQAFKNLIARSHKSIC